MNVPINWHVFMTSDTYRTIIQKLNLSNYFYNSSYKSKFYNINYVIELEKKLALILIIAYLIVLILINYGYKHLNLK